MKAHAETVIFCPMRDGSYWTAHGSDRKTAEIFFLDAITNKGLRPPLYRIIVQLKVDQHDDYPLLAVRQ